MRGPQLGETGCANQKRGLEGELRRAGAADLIDGLRPTLKLAPNFQPSSASIGRYWSARVVARTV